MSMILSVNRYWLALPRMSGLLIILLPLLSISSFTHSFAQVKTTRFGDTIKGNIKNMIEFNEANGFLITAVYTWDTITHTRTIKYLDESGVFKGKMIAQYDSQDRLTSENLYCYDGKPCTKLNLKYNKLDKVTNYQYVHYSNRTESSAMGECNDLWDWLNGQITYWIIFDSSVDIRTYKYDIRGRVAKTERINILDGDTTIKLTDNKYDFAGNNTESKILTISAGTLDTAIKIIYYRYYDSGDKYVEQKTISYPPGHYQPDTTVEIKHYNHNEQEELYKPGNFRDYTNNKEYDKQGNIIRIPPHFRREIEYY